MRSGPQGSGWLTRDALWSKQLQDRGQQIRADLHLTAAGVHVSTIATQDQKRDQLHNLLSDCVWALVLVF